MSYDVHPVADLFPMLPDDELDELASDIRERGLLQPIVLDAEGRVLDGRNRLAACELIGLEPTFTTYEGVDPDGYALAVNIARRHLSTGARAMIAAKAARLNGSGVKATARGSDLNPGRISDAMAVLDWAPDHVTAVIAGTMPLSVAVAEARERKREAEALETKMARLRQEATDLADLVTEERMGVDDAIAVLDARLSKAEQEQRAAAAEKRRLRDEAQAESGSAIRRFSAIAGQLIGTVDPGKWQVGEDEWGAFLQAVTAVRKWKD